MKSKPKTIENKSPDFITQFEMSQLLHSFSRIAYEKYGLFNSRPRFLIKTPEVKDLPQGDGFFEIEMIVRRVK